ncbi:UNVERIFIED_CONTAM: Aspartyl protease 25 [Sesamum angustifolium]|uniref:Aspartyl protease 25 n=1 Tax=Sesamum angustifolium TaxID=2727405 RepID=A0AAW2PBV4_9LAMI
MLNGTRTRWKRLKKAADSDAQEAFMIVHLQEGTSWMLLKKASMVLRREEAQPLRRVFAVVHIICREGQPLIAMLSEIVILLRSLMNGAALFSGFCSLAVRNLFNSNVEFDHFKHPALHLPLYHVREQRPDSPQSLEAPVSFLEALHLDDARVKFLNSRLTKINLTSSGAIKSGHLIDGNSVSVPLNPGESLGIANYYTRIGLGTPPTYHLVVVDTGSSFSWIQCEPCTVYCHPQVGSRFDPAASQTYQLLSCDTNQCSSLKAPLSTILCAHLSNACVYTATYGDQSFSMGYLSKDSLTFGTESLPGFVFGCGQDNDGLFGKSAGLVGLAKNELSCYPSCPLSTGKSSRTASPQPHPWEKPGVEVFYPLGLIQILATSSRQCVREAVRPGCNRLQRSHDHRLGTTISRLAGPVYSALKEELVKAVNEISSVVPSVQMIFQGNSTSLIMFVIEVEKGTTCLSFAGNSNLRDIAIIGNQQQQTFEIVYDLANSRIGFAAGGCR